MTDNTRDPFGADYGSVGDVDEGDRWGGTDFLAQRLRQRGLQGANGHNGHQSPGPTGPRPDLEVPPALRGPGFQAGQQYDPSGVPPHPGQANGLSSAPPPHPGPTYGGVPAPRAEPPMPPASHSHTPAGVEPGYGTSPDQARPFEPSQPRDPNQAFDPGHSFDPARQFDPGHSIDPAQPFGGPTNG
jgi:hypothetical protein